MARNGSHDAHKHPAHEPPHRANFTSSWFRNRVVGLKFSKLLLQSGESHYYDRLRLNIGVKPMQDNDSYEQMQETLALLKILAQGREQIEAGKVRDAADVIASLRARR